MSRVLQSDGSNSRGDKYRIGQAMYFDRSRETATNRGGDFMTYTKLTISQIRKQFELQKTAAKNLFANITLVTPSEMLRTLLTRDMALAEAE